MTAAPQAAPGAPDSLAEELGRFGAQVETFFGGLLVATVPLLGSATDQATQAMAQLKALGLPYNSSAPSNTKKRR